jgi:hypothetical protein
MAPLEKYTNKHTEETSPSLNESQSKKPLEGKTSQDTQRYLERMKNNFRLRFDQSKHERIARAADKAKREFAEGENQKKEEPEYQEIVARRRETRLEQYRDKQQADAAFDQITELKLNIENFRSEKGWQYQYLYQTDETGTAPKDRMSLEAFVLEKQYAEIDNIRDTLVEARINTSIEDIYPDLKGEQNNDKKAAKVSEKKLQSQQFFTGKKDQIEDYFSTDFSPAQRQSKGKELSEAFKTEVFGDLNFSDPANAKAKTAVDTMFASLLLDYQNMIDAKNSVARLNNIIVAKLTKDDLTEEEWLEALAKQAEEEAKKLEEERRQQALQVKAESTGTPGTGNIEASYYTAPITAGEQLSPNTEIKINLIDPTTGTYRIRFPQESGEGMETDFRLRQIPGNNGQTRNVYIFNDHLLPHPEVVADSGNSFRGEVNNLYLRHVMAESVKQGKDYLGPDLSSMMSAQEMNFIAGNLFYPNDPGRLAQTPMTVEQARIFKNLVLLITNSANNNSGGGERPYGNLMAADNRIKLLTYVINPANGAGANRDLWFNYLKDPDETKYRSTNMEVFCREIMKIPANNGNFTENLK